MKALNSDAKIIKLNINTNLKNSLVALSPLSSVQHNHVSMLVTVSRN